MRWGRHEFAARPRRPKVRPLKDDERERLLATMTGEIERSPVLTAFHVRLLHLRGRFYLEWQWNPSDGPEQRTTHGRITPLDDAGREFLLEVERRRNQWSEVARGSPTTLIKKVAGETKGTFHGLGLLDKSLREAAKAGLARLTVKQAGPAQFVYAGTEEPCTVQEALYHFFGLPIHVIARPAGWYSYHRTPRILEFSEDRTRVLVRFSASSWSGETFGGTALYLKRNGEWGAYTIRPNQSDDIATAEAWLVKRKWKPWY